MSVGGFIFPHSSTGLFGPTGLGGGSPINSWSDTGQSGSGTYTICLTGAFEVDACRTVGGTTSFLTGSGSSSSSIALLAVGIAAVVVVIGAAGWYTRRRRLSR